MSVQFKFHNRVGERRRRDIVKALAEAGFAAQSLFPGQKRLALAAIFTVAKAEAKDVRAALGEYRADIEYVEGSPNRSLKA
jgi:hypothetical protein